MIIPKHAEEVFWLEQRMLFLKKLNDLLIASPDASDEDLKKNAEDIAKDFKKIEEPQDLIQRLKEVYGKELEA